MKRRTPLEPVGLEHLDTVAGGFDKEWDNRVVERMDQYKEKYDDNWNTFFGSNEWHGGVVSPEDHNHHLPVFKTENMNREIVQGLSLNMVRGVPSPGTINYGKETFENYFGDGGEGDD